MEKKFFEQELKTWLLTHAGVESEYNRNLIYNTLKSEFNKSEPIAEVDVEKLAENHAYTIPTLEGNGVREFLLIKESFIAGFKAAQSNRFSEVDAIAFGEWLETETSYKRYWGGDDNDGMWHDIFTEGINRHYFSDKELLQKFKNRNK